MGSIADKFAEAFRDFITDGLPASGAYEPDKSTIRALGTIIETAVASAGASITRYPTVAAMDAVTSAADGQLAYVYDNNGVPDDPLNGIYQWDDGANDWVLAEWYAATLAAIVQPLVDDAEDARDAASGFADDAAASAALLTIDGPLMTARVNSLIGTSDTYTNISGYPAVSTLAISANRAYVAAAVDAGADVAVGAVIDSFIAEIILDATCTNLRLHVYRGSTAAGGINTAPPNTPGTGGAWTLLQTIDIVPLTAGITVGASALGTATIPITPIVAATGMTYAFVLDARDVGDARLRLGYGYRDATGDGRQRFYGWYHASTATTTWTNHLATQKLAVRIGTIAITDVLDLDDYVSTITARQLSDEQTDEINTLMEVYSLNVSRMIASTSLYPITPGDAFSYWGDSLTAQAAVTDGEESTNIVGDFLTGETVNNYGIGGETSTQIDTRIAAAAAGTLNDYSQVWAGTNDLNPANLPGVDTSDMTATIKAVIDTSMGRFGHTRYMVCGPQTGVVGTRTFGTVQKLRALLRTTYGAKAWSSYDIHPYVTTRSASDVADLTIGGMPASIMYDSTHHNDAGALAIGRLYGWFARSMVGGTPYVHPDIVGIKNGAAVDSAVHTTRILGTPTHVGLWRAKNRDVVRIDPTTGALTRGAGAVDFDTRDTFIEAMHRKGGHIGRITLVRQMDGTDPNLGGVRFDTSKGMTALGTPGLTGVTNGKKLTIVVCARFVAGMTASGGLVGSATWLNVLAKSFRFIPKNSAGVSLASATAPQADNPENYNMYFFSVDTTTGVDVTHAAVNDKAAVTSVPTADATLGLTDIIALFMSTGAFLTGVDIKSIWIGADRFDFTDLTKRALFTTGAPYNVPLDIGASGVVGGVTPFIYMCGRMGDFILGTNRGSGGNLYFPQWIDSAHCGLSSPPDLT